MAVVVADTDVLIDFLAGRGQAATRVDLELARGALATTAVSRFELLSGARTVGAERRIRLLLDSIVTLPLDARAADHAARARRSLESKGSKIGMGDSLIAGIVLASGAALLTRNRRHFERVEGLALVSLDRD